MKISDILTDESKWTRGVFARNENDDPVDSLSKEAVKFCLIGAANRACYESNSSDVRSIDRLHQIVVKRGYTSVSMFNDASDVTFSDILEVIKEADV